MADEYIFDVVNQASGLDWAFPFQRSDAFPLDRSSLFSSMDDAIAYAKGDGSDERGLGGASYAGQVISVYDADSNSVDLYVIDADRSLKGFGSASVDIDVDNVSIENRDGKIGINNFGKQYYAYDETGDLYTLVEGFKEGLAARVVEGENGLEIAWYEPSTRMQNAISGLVEEVTGLGVVLGEVDADVNKLLVELPLKANINDVYTKTQVDNIVAGLDHLKRKIVVSLEAIDKTADDAEQYIYMVPNAATENYDEYMVIDGELEKVGDWTTDLSGYATKQYVDEELSKKVDSEDLVDALNKLATIEEGAQKNYISSIDDLFTLSDSGTLGINEIPQEKITNLIDDLNNLTSEISTLEELLENKVEKIDNARLMTVDEGNKLSSIVDLIHTLNPEHFSLSSDKELSISDNFLDKLNNKVDSIEGWTLLSPTDKAKLNALVLEGENIEISGKVNASNVQGLEDWITEHSSSVKGLSENNLTNDLLDKLNNAEANYISSVDENQLSVLNGNLSIKAVEQSQVNGLIDALNALASKTDLDAANERIDEIEERLNWSAIE